MWTKLLMGVYLALLISLTASDEFSTERTKSKQRYRIVKIYGRKLKSTTTTTPPSFNRKNDTSLEEIKLPRDMLRRQRGSDKVINMGEIDFANLDVAKLLAASGHSNSGDVDPMTPTVVRFSAPSSDSHLDPAYLTQLIKEQLGSDAQFTIIPSSGNEANILTTQNLPLKLSISNQEGYTTTTNTTAQHQQLRGGFKGTSPASNYSPTSSIPNNQHTYPALRMKTHYDGRSSKSTTHTGTPPPSTTFSQGPRTFPIYARNPTNSAPEVELSNLEFSGLTSQPTSSTPTTHQEFIPPKSYNPHTATTAQPLFGHHPPSGYSTLSQGMTPPGIEAAIIGQYGHFEIQKEHGQQHEEHRTVPSFPVQKGHKYSAIFVRGFTEGTGKESGQNYYTNSESSSGKAYSSFDRTPWKALKEGPKPPPSDGYWSSGFQSSPQPFVQEPSQSLTLPEPLKSYSDILPHPSTFEILKTQDMEYKAPSSSYEGLNFYSDQQFQPSKAPSQNYETYSLREYGKGRGHAEDDFALTNPNPPAEYDPPSTHSPSPSPLPTSSYHHQTSSSTKQDPSILYGKPNQDISPRPPATKTIYVNLPPVSPPSTTPKPYMHQIVLPQKHYKIIFIKAPTAAPPEEPEIEVTPPPQSKTIIYVLHKKPESLEKVTIQAPRPTQPPSPEVFFIQYKDGKKNLKKHHEGPWERSDENRGHDDDASSYNAGEMEPKTKNPKSQVYPTKSQVDDEIEDYDAQGYPGTQYKMKASSTAERLHVNGNFQE